MDFEAAREWLPDKKKNVDLDQLRSLVFDQLICQRLQRGFQIILLKKKIIHSAIDANLDEGMVSEGFCSFFCLSMRV